MDDDNIGSDVGIPILIGYIIMGIVIWILR